MAPMPEINPGIPCRLLTPHVSWILRRFDRNGCNVVAIVFIYTVAAKVWITLIAASYFCLRNKIDLCFLSAQIIISSCQRFRTSPFYWEKTGLHCKLKLSKLSPLCRNIIIIQTYCYNSRPIQRICVFPSGMITHKFGWDDPNKWNKIPHLYVYYHAPPAHLSTLLTVSSCWRHYTRCNVPLSIWSRERRRCRRLIPPKWPPKAEWSYQRAFRWRHRRQASSSECAPKIYNTTSSDYQVLFITKTQITFVVGFWLHVHL